VPQRDPLGGPEQGGPFDECPDRRLPASVNTQPGEPLGQRNVPVEPLLRAADPAVPAGQDPGRGSLEEHQAADCGLDLGHDLDRGGPGAHHREPLAFEVIAVVPARGMEYLAGEGRQPRDVGK
jgi:hypothetical protein